ncbi:MAG: PIN domain-containing protein [Myxococcales bacterium]|nr:PIN domain-containing protein [Myxococcales bacterium]
MKATAFLDTGIFVAFLEREDHLHQKARALFGGLPESGAVETSLAVIGETYSLLLHRYGEERARSLRALLVALPRLEILPLDLAHHAAVERKLDRLRGLKLTYVDASSLVFLGERKIKTVWGTDRDLAIEGARLLPEDDA